MKYKLMIQSLSPLALLTMIRNCSFVFRDESEKFLTANVFLTTNIVLLIVFLMCFLWLCAAIFFYIEFKAFKWVDRKSGYEIKTIGENEEASLNFFLTIIIPLLIDDVNTLQGAVTFVVIVSFILILLYRTKLFYANPILSVLGYRFFEFEFVDNDEVDGMCFALCRSQIGVNHTVEYKKINGNVYYVKEEK
ncbi:MAG: hypothetical protein PHY47_16965 [Lachnospiraceae bacterium]|nr:hypothetical protein [Lachnospiraceae bacterium]